MAAFGYKAFSSVALVAVAIASISAVASAADAPAPSPTSGAVEIYAPVAGVLIAAVAALFA